MKKIQPFIARQDRRRERERSLLELRQEFAKLERRERGLERLKADILADIEREAVTDRVLFAGGRPN